VGGRGKGLIEGGGFDEGVRKTLIRRPVVAPVVIAKTQRKRRCSVSLADAAGASKSIAKMASRS